MADHASDYQSLLSEHWDEIQDPVMLPSGSWRLRCRNASMQPAKTAEGNPSALFVYEPQEPMEDVSQDALDALGEDYNFSDNRIFFRIWISDGADKASLRKHLLKHGVDLSGMSIIDSLKAVKGTEVIAYLAQKQITTRSGETRVENDPQNFAAVE